MQFINISYYKMNCSKYKANYCKSTRSLLGKTTLINCANSEIGYETALEFAKREARVILTCSNLNEAEKIRENIMIGTGNVNVVAKQVDMGSSDSIKSFAINFNETEERLDILVNNDKRWFSGAFPLYMLLLDKLKKSAPSRIVSVFSADDYINEDRFLRRNDLRFNAHVIRKFGEQLKGTGVTVYLLNPGNINLNVLDNNQSPVKKLIKRFSSVEMRGVETTLHCALEENIEELSGSLFENCGVIAEDNDYDAIGENRNAENFSEEAACFVNYLELL